MFKDRPTEVSLNYFKKQKLFVTVYGYYKKGSIGLRVSRNIEGPWSSFLEIYKPPDIEWSKKYFSYAPKAHPEISDNNNELLITYITNSYQPMDIFEDHRVYYPRFISLSISDKI
jgi:hypothetical protein